MSIKINPFQNTEAFNFFQKEENLSLFTVKDGKFTNPDGWQLVYNEEKGYTEAV